MHVIEAIIGIDGGIKNLGLSYILMCNEQQLFVKTFHVHLTDFWGSLKFLRRFVNTFGQISNFAKLTIAIEDFYWVKGNAQSTKFAFTNFAWLKEQIGYVQGITELLFDQATFVRVQRSQVKRYPHSRVIKNPNARDAYAVACLGRQAG